MNNYIIVMDPVNGPHLEHKAHKYTKRQWINGKWRYWYDTKITGKEYLRKKEANDRGFKLASDPNNIIGRYDGYITTKGGIKIGTNSNKEFYARKSEEWKRAYYNKSLKGNIDYRVNAVKQHIDAKNYMKGMKNKQTLMQKVQKGIDIVKSILSKIGGKKK